jgi:D-tyrosyl-tRNA(Tyr) deacylase
MFKEKFSVVLRHSTHYPNQLTFQVSQFTLLATTKKGNKPDFHRSAGGDKARDLYTKFFSRVQTLYEQEKVKDGIFQAMMDVALVNDGPVGVDYRCEDGAVNIRSSSSP